ncbi:hypothetical protein V6N13_103408 [Hibiscus sabdariffa]
MLKLFSPFLTFSFFLPHSKIFFFGITVQTPPESGRPSSPAQQKKPRVVPDSSKESSAVPDHAKPLQSKAPESRYAHDSNPGPQGAVSL